MELAKDLGDRKTTDAVVQSPSHVISIVQLIETVLISDQTTDVDP